VLTNGEVRCWGDNGLLEVNARRGDAGPLPPVRVHGIDPDVVQVAVGYSHSCALTSAGGVQCWGYNWEGELGAGWKGNPVPGALPVVGLSQGVTWIAADGDHTCAVTAAGGVQCWGDNAYGALGGNATPHGNATPVDVPALPSGVASVDAGRWHVCALMGTGEVRCWGYNRYRQLGDGTTDPSSVPVTVEGLDPSHR
jgi:alpha-tubulin suppressor-like RCC1 family protein